MTPYEVNNRDRSSDERTAKRGENATLSRSGFFCLEKLSDVSEVQG